MMIFYNMLTDFTPLYINKFKSFVNRLNNGLKHKNEKLSICFYLQKIFFFDKQKDKKKVAVSSDYLHGRKII